jgi:hypothetical protein
MKKLLLSALILVGINANAQFPAPYCANTFTNGVEPITLVNFAGINNTSPNTLATAPHQDFTAIVGNVIAGNTYPIIVKGNTDGNYNSNISLFVDWNSDNDFLDAGESYNVGSIANSTGLDAVQATTSILVPGNATAGNKRMRVIKKYNNGTVFPLPCTTGAGFGQAEDYTLAVTVPSCISPSGGSASVNTTLLTADLTWTSGGANSEIVVQLAEEAAPSVAPNTGTNVAGSTYQATSLFADTLYEFYVRTECVDGVEYSAWAGPFAFNTFLPASCTTVIYPANGATGIPAGTTATPVPLTFAWDEVLEAVSYNLYYGTSATGSATILLSNYTTTTATINITGYNALFYWKIVPIGPGGAAVGCTDWTFTTGADPLANETFEYENIAVYPNPATNVVNISSKNNGINSVVMTDVNGRTVKNVNVASATEAQINISDLAAGVYMMKITSNEGTTTKKIIKE